MEFPDIPNGSILGINYSGIHDTAIAIISPEGDPVFAMSLERLTRVKQDARPPHELLEKLPWGRIDFICTSTNRTLPEELSKPSQVFPTKFSSVTRDYITHGSEFIDFFSSLSKEVIYVDHQFAHAASAVWPSGFERSFCMTYDGGISNSKTFGGLFDFSRTNGIDQVDAFDITMHPKVSTLYTFVTGLLGFTPNKHEGKITGLAARGKVIHELQILLNDLLCNEFSDMEETIRLFFQYSDVIPPVIKTDAYRLDGFIKRFQFWGMEDIAANVQYFAEQHIVAILENCRRLNWWNQDSNICLAGGLFANVKINQTVSKMGFSKVFIAPAMTDDGSALGAALVGLSNIGKVHSKTISNMYLGSEYSESKIRATIKKYNLVISSEAASPESVADLLNNDKIVAIFGGRSEFGPRALGNRSILATAKDAAINDQLNRKLRRTEFMPFAPVIRDVDFGDAFEPNTGIELTSEYMTMAVDCKEDFARSHPAVVHVDGTARPQMIRESANPNYYALLTAYKELSGQIALVNTSFNVHEEPIVESPDDAIRGFLESGLDYLYFTNGILLSYEQNQAATIQVLREKIFRGTADSRQRSEITKFLEIERGTFLASSQALLVERDVLIQQREYWVARAQELELKMNS